MRKRGKAVLVRLNEQEYVHLKRQSEITGLKMEPLVRQLILGRDVKLRPPENLAALLRQMSAMGNNINQIAKVANSSKFIRSEDMEAIQKMQDELWQAIKELRKNQLEGGMLWDIQRSLPSGNRYTYRWLMRPTKKRPVWIGW